MVTRLLVRLKIAGISKSVSSWLMQQKSPDASGDHQACKNEQVNFVEEV